MWSHLSHHTYLCAGRTPGEKCRLFDTAEPVWDMSYEQTAICSISAHDLLRTNPRNFQLLRVEICHPRATTTSIRKAKA